MKSFVKVFSAMCAVLALLVSCEKNEPEPVTPPEGPTPEVLDLSLTVKDITQTEALLDIVASNQDSTFYYGIIEKEEFDAYENDSAFLDADLSYLTQLAQQYNMTLVELLTQELKSGDVSDWEYQGLSPDTKYYCYAYGITRGAHITSPLYKTEFKTLAVEQEECTFEIAAEELTSSSMVVRITPSNANTSYYYDLLDASSYESLCGSKPEGVPAVVEMMIETGVNEYGLTVQEAVSRMSSMGEVSAKFESLLPNTAYYAFAVGLGVDGTITTSAQVTEIVTAPSAANSFKIALAEVGADHVSIDIEPELLTDSYGVITLADNMIDGKSDDEILALIVDHYSDDIISSVGYSRYSRTLLIPNTSYTAYVFGYVNGVATTAVNKISFVTAAPEFYGDEDFFAINPYESSQACLWVSITPKRDDVSFYFDILPEETYQANGGNDEAIKQDIEAGISRYMEAYNCDRSEALLHLLHTGRQSPEGGTGDILTPNTDYRIYAVGMYADGTLSTNIISVKASTKGNFVPIEVVVEPLAGYETQYCYVRFFPDPESTSTYAYRVFINDSSHAALSDEELREVVLAHGGNLGFTVGHNTTTSLPVKFDVPNDELSIYCFSYDPENNPSPVQRLSWTQNGGLVEK